MKKEANKLKVYLLIFNIILAVVSFSYLINAQTPPKVEIPEKPISGSKTSDIDSANKALELFSTATTWGDFLNDLSSLANKKTDSSSPNPTRGPGASSNPIIGIEKAEDSKSADSGGETKIPDLSESEEVDLPAKIFFDEFEKQHPNAKGLAESFGYGEIYKKWKEYSRSKMKKSGAIPGKGSSTTPTPGIPSPPEPPKSIGGSIENYFDDFLDNLKMTVFGAGIGAVIGLAAGGNQGYIWGAVSGGAGTLVYQILSKAGFSGLQAGLIGIGVAVTIFLLTYKKDRVEIVEFNCLPWQAPIGGEDCEKCNLYEECSEYTCKSLGQACELVNIGLKNQKCIWKNPYDTNSPIINFLSVKESDKYLPANSIKKTSSGVEIKTSDVCLKAFTQLEFKFLTDEPSQCKIDYTLTTDPKLAFEEMNFYVGGDLTFSYNHTEKLALPGADIINKTAPELKNDGTYTLYLRCMDANGNFNVNAYSIRFCVDPGPDETAPVIVNVSIPSNMPIQFNRTSLFLEVYVNEPADCKWDKEDIDYVQMENSMICKNNLWEMNNENTYTCRVNLTGIESRKENNFFFRCKDKPDYEEKERNENTKSYLYTVIGTQALNILDFGPTGKVLGATDYIPVDLYIKTDNGYNNGEAKCYYSFTGNENSYIEFSNTTSNEHSQRLDLVSEDYTYYFKCVDLGGNAVYNITRFSVESDRNSPEIARIYKEVGELKIITNKESFCSYSNTNCNFEIDSGIQMLTIDKISHIAEWEENKDYYIRCKDNYNNQPDPNVCSIIVKSFAYNGNKDVYVL